MKPIQNWKNALLMYELLTQMDYEVQIPKFYILFDFCSQQNIVIPLSKFFQWFILFINIHIYNIAAFAWWLSSISNQTQRLD